MGIKRLFQGAGTGAFYMGWGAFAILFSIVDFVVPAIAGLSINYQRQGRVK